MADERKSMQKMLDRLAKRLEKAIRVDQIKAIRNQAEARRAYARAAPGGQEILNKWAELRLRASALY